MEHRISASELGRRVSSVLARARNLPVAAAAPASLADASAAWRSAGEPEPEFAADLERVAALGRLPADPRAL